MPSIYFTYILKSTLCNKHYYCHTSDLDKRLNERNSGLSEYTKRYLPWKLIYFEEFSTRSESMKRKNIFEKSKKLIIMLSLYA
ncbi:MAG: GIY-YIG nuclease family protein [Ignavibacteriales bacterium]|nr:GIY-YIG nuclease family protein [Ignavibacteriales bacterium]